MPEPGALSTWSCPPWRDTMPSASESPRPDASRLVVKKGERIVRCKSSVIPMPVSAP